MDKVKRSENGVITDPFYLSPEHTLEDANNLVAKFRISGVPITENGKLVGIITNRDLKFETDFTKKIKESMTSENLITAKVGVTLDEAKAILAKSRKEKLPIVDDDFNLKGLSTIKDIEKQIKYPLSAKDSQGRLLCGAAIGITANCLERVDALVKAKVDVIVMDSAHGHSANVLRTVRMVKEKYPDAKIVFVGPCVAKRKEVKLDPCVDFTLTFEEVGSVLEGLGIKIEEAQPFSVLFNAVREAHGFAQSGGVINAVKVYLKDENVNAVQVANLTKKNVALLRAYAKTGKAPAQFIEVMACEGGCVTGPCTHADKTAGQKQLIKELTKF